MRNQWLAGISAFYLVFLGVLLGSTLALGALTAPVIFGANHYLDTAILSRYGSGQLMSEIFARYVLILKTGLVVVVLYEGWRLWLKERGVMLLIAATAILVAGGAFAFYYTPGILEAQALGEEATTTAAFDTLHKGAEMSFKLLSFAFAALLFLRALRLQKAY
jgi:hypothetical protein